MYAHMPFMYACKSTANLNWYSAESDVSLPCVVGVAVHETSEHASLTFGYSADGDINKTKGPRAPNAIRTVDQHWAVVCQSLVHLAKGHRETGRRAEDRQAVLTVRGASLQYSNSVQCV